MLIAHGSFTILAVLRRRIFLYVALHKRRRRSSRTPDRTARMKIVTLKNISEKLHAWRRYRASLRELYSLTDRELDDLGICRWEIDDVARRSAGL